MREYYYSDEDLKIISYLKSNDLSFIKDNSSNYKTRLSNGFTLLHIATQYSDLNTIQELLNHIDINSENIEGITPQNLITHNKNIDVINYFKNNSTKSKDINYETTSSAVDFVDPLSVSLSSKDMENLYDSGDVDSEESTEVKEVEEEISYNPKYSDSEFCTFDYLTNKELVDNCLSKFDSKTNEKEFVFMYDESGNKRNGKKFAILSSHNFYINLGWYNVIIDKNECNNEIEVREKSKKYLLYIYKKKKKIVITIAKDNNSTNLINELKQHL